VTDLERQRTVLIAYLRSKIEAGDWHAVSDAANDLRVLEAQMACAKCDAAPSSTA
jgi:hypothetical protein